MDLYRCDYTLRPVEIIDDYESLIWTDRYVGAGDFKLVVKENHMLRYVTWPGNYLQCSESGSMMMIETVSIKRQEAGKGQINLMEITGRSMEAFLTMRTSKSLPGGGAGNYGKDPESFTGTVGSIGKQIVDKYCINPASAGPVNVIPNLEAVNFYGTVTTTATFERGPIYDYLTNLALAYGAGWRIQVNDGKMTFFMYDGIDKTDPATSYYRVYSADDDNLYNTSTLKSSSNFKNHARVLGKTIGIDVFAAGYDSTVSGLNRRTMIVEANEIDDIPSLTNIGKRALADDSNRLVSMIDGDIPTNSWNDIYYGLGDIVWVKDTYGEKVKMRVIEEILSSDASNPFSRTPTFDMV